MAGISALIGGIALLGFLVFLAGVGLVVVAASQQKPVRGGVLLAISGLAFGVLLSIISQGVIVVQPGEVAVIFNTLSGDVEETPLQSGTHIVMPILQDATLYTVRQQEYTMSSTASEGAQQGNDAIAARTSDGQNVALDITIIFNISTENADTIHVRWRNDYLNGFIRPTVRSVVRDEVARSTAENLYGEGRQDVQVNSQDTLKDLFLAEGLELTSILVRQIDFSAEFSAAIEEKQTEEQRKQRAATEAERLIIEAEGRANAVRAEAEGAADAVILAAEAQAKALELISNQIAANPSLIQYEYIQNLSDNVELVLIPSNSPFLFDFNSIADLPDANTDFEAPVVPDSSDSGD
jgi:prohibitin 2